MKTKRKRHVGGSGWTGSDHARRDEQKQERQRRRLEKKLRQRQEEQQQNDNEGGQQQHQHHHHHHPHNQVAHTADDKDNGDIIIKKQEAGEKRRAKLTHETKEKRDKLKLHLHVTKTKREIDELKKRLQAWDPIEEKEKDRKQKEEAEKAAAEAEAEASGTKKKKKRKGRKGPESWKLKGAARPAWEVYDFDTRYVDPHIKAHEEAAARAKRSVNILSAYKGRIIVNDDDDNDNDIDPLVGPIIRQYLSLLMQLGHLYEESKQYKSARSAWLECVELEGETTPEPMTTARECLIRMYMRLKRYEAVVRLGSKITIADKSVWVRYSIALASYILKKDNTEDWLVHAIKSNVFSAYYIAYYDTTFVNVMEYTDELDDALMMEEETAEHDDDDNNGNENNNNNNNNNNNDNSNIEDIPQSSLEEAIEYCSKECELWSETGAAEILRDIVRQATTGRYGNQISISDMEWKERLTKIEHEYDARTATSTNTNGGGDDDIISNEGDDDDDNEGGRQQHVPVDLKMYVGMYRTAMEMLEDSGELTSLNTR